MSLSACIPLLLSLFRSTVTARFSHIISLFLQSGADDGLQLSTAAVPELLHRSHLTHLCDLSTPLLPLSDAERHEQLKCFDSLYLAPICATFVYLWRRVRFHASLSPPLDLDSRRLAAFFLREPFH